MTIPDDVMKAAQEVAKSCVERPYNKGTVAKAAGRIARAIMAERERCATVVEEIAHEGLHESLWKRKFKNAAEKIRRGAA